MWKVDFCRKTEPSLSLALAKVLLARRLALPMIGQGSAVGRAKSSASSIGALLLSGRHFFTRIRGDRSNTAVSSKI